MTSAVAPVGAHVDWPADAIEVGRIGEPWGLKGWVKVQPFAADAQALFSARRWFLLPPEKAGPPRVAAGAVLAPSLLKITQVKDHGNIVVALAHEIPDRHTAESLRGSRVFIGRASFPVAASGEFYWVDLIGCSVVNREGEMLGTVAGLIETGPHSVLRVVPGLPLEGGSESVDERLIPFVGAYVEAVNLGRRLIEVDWGSDY